MLSKRLVDKKIIFLVIIIAVFLILNIEIDYWSLRRNLDSVKYLDYIENYSAEYGIEKELLAAVIYVESRFDPYSKSSKGAQGLMHIMQVRQMFSTGFKLVGRVILIQKK